MVKKRLKALGLKLPELSPPGGSYVSVNQRGKVAYVAIQFPIRNGAYLYLGRYGKELNTEQGYEATQLVALNILAQVDHYIGFKAIEGLNHLDIYYRAVKGWDDAPIIVNGASDLMIDVLGNRGKHSRGLFGIKDFPRNFSVGITSSFTLR